MGLQINRCLHSWHKSINSKNLKVNWCNKGKNIRKLDEVLNLNGTKQLNYTTSLNVANKLKEDYIQMGLNVSRMSREYRLMIEYTWMIFLI